MLLVEWCRLVWRAPSIRQSLLAPG